MLEQTFLLVVLISKIIGNLDPDVDEKVLYDTFSVFGLIISTNVLLIYINKLDYERS
jgi:hypothetical protein